MAKNDKLINLCRENAFLKAENKRLIEDALKEEVKQVTPAVYACFAKVLFEDYKMDAEQIEELFLKTQECWNESLDMMDSMIEWCEETTGIDLKLTE